MLLVSALRSQTGTDLLCPSSNAHLLNLLCGMMHAVFLGCFIHIWIIYQRMLMLANNCTDTHSELHSPGM